LGAADNNDKKKGDRSHLRLKKVCFRVLSVRLDLSTNDSELFAFLAGQASCTSQMMYPLVM